MKSIHSNLIMASAGARKSCGAWSHHDRMQSWPWLAKAQLFLLPGSTCQTLKMSNDPVVIIIQTHTSVHLSPREAGIVMSNVNCVTDTVVLLGDSISATQLRSSLQTESNKLLHLGPLYQLFFLLGKLFPKTSQTWLSYHSWLASMSPPQRGHSI